MKNNKKIKYTTWKEYVYLKRVKFLLIFLLIICLLTISLIPFIKLPSATSNEVSLFVNYADNDLGSDIVPEGLKYNWYLDGFIIEFGTVGASGILSFSIMDTDGVYILELGKDQYNGNDYTPNIMNFTYIHGVFASEIEIGTKTLEGNMFWEGAIAIGDQYIDLYYYNGGTYELVGAYLSDLEGFVQANVIYGLYQWRLGDQLPSSPISTSIQWHDNPKHTDFTFALKVVRGIIIMVFSVILEKGGFRVTIFIFLTISNK